jgi:uncharacterized membrane protein YgdD (TMEM256/DUF423 family)
MPASLLVRIGAILGGVTVALGAFGAHFMKDHYEAAALQTFETAVRYQMYHALAVVLCGALAAGGRRTTVAAGLFLAGILLFSGSLYGFVFTQARWLLPVTPIGGVAFLAGWLALALSGMRTTARTAS